MRLLLSCLLIISSLQIIGCANMKTVDRTTQLPKYHGDQSGKAIHLDVQQRLVIMNSFEEYCAEPSPDALAAYSASLGFGFSDSTKKAASLSQALQSSAASIGLRTQSITLMRDALYRMCEAYMNNSLDRAQVAVLLNRSQDLTAVILAVEQLTGATAANQALLTSTASSQASAILANTQEKLDAVAKEKERKQANYLKAIEKQNTLQTEVDHLKQTSHPTAAQQEELRKEELRKKEPELTTAKQEAALLKDEYDLLVQNHEELLDIRDTALTSSIATVSSSGQSSTISQANTIDKATPDTIVNAVQNMVTEVLKKSYVTDYCMAMIVSPPIFEQNDSPQSPWQHQITWNLCTQIILAEHKGEEDSASLEALSKSLLISVEGYAATAQADQEKNQNQIDEIKIKQKEIELKQEELELKQKKLEKEKEQFKEEKQKQAKQELQKNDSNITSTPGTTSETLQSPESQDT